MANTVMSEAFESAGVEREETPQEAAERIWKEAKSDPVETLQRFVAWAESQPCSCCGMAVKPTRLLALLGIYWPRVGRGFLDRRKGDKGWKHGAAFGVAMNNRQKKRRGRFDSDLAYRKRTNANSLRQYYRKRDGVKVVQAEVSIATGEINLIDKACGPFADIRINGLGLPKATTEQALAWCDRQTTDVRYVRALCSLTPDPRKPIGEQWTPEIIRQARAMATNE